MSNEPTPNIQITEPTIDDDNEDTVEIEYDELDTLEIPFPNRG